MKICFCCKIEKSVSEFNVRKDRNKLDSYCKICRSEYYKAKAYDRKSYHSSYKRVVTDERREYVKAFKNGRRHKYSDKETRAIYDLIRRVLKYKSEKRSGARHELLGWSKKEFLETVGCLTEGTHLDHKIPMSWFTKEAPCSIVNHLSNLQILSAEVNIRKKNRYNDTVSFQYLEIAKQYIKKEYLDIL